jgi:hypothetical protein
MNEFEEKLAVVLFVRLSRHPMLESKEKAILKSLAAYFNCILRKEKDVECSTVTRKLSLSTP